jgi:O-antigen ligase
MALICVAFISCITLMVGYKMAPRQIRDVIKVGLLSLVGLLLIISSTDLIPDAIKSILEAYDNRSGLNETYGRFSIWTDAVSVWTQRNLLWGVGFGQIQYYTTTARACHNTWLEFLCSSGLVAGTITLIYFTTVLLAGLRTAI